ncbi:MAG: DMT family transporter [Bacteroidia bacterium]
MSQSIKVHIALFTVSFIYAITYSLVKDIMPHYIQGFGLIIIRVIGASILFLSASYFFPREKIDWKNHGWRLFFCSVFGVVANMLMFFKGLEITSPINGAVLMLASPIFVLILNTFVNKQSLLLVQVLGIILACFGCLVLMMGKSFSFSSATLPGDILILLNAMSFASFLVLSKNLLQHYKPITVAKYTFLIGSVLVIPFGYSELMEAKFSEMDLIIVLEILFIIVCTTFVTFLLNAWAVSKAGPTIVGAYIYLQPVLATILAIFLKKDVLNMHKILALLLIFAGVYITSNKNKWYKSKV